MSPRREFLDFSSAESCQKQNIAEGVTVRAFYLHSTCLAILEMEPNSILPEHKHIHEQISFVLEGEVQVSVGHENRTARKGELFAVKSNTLHACRALSQPVRIIVASSPLLHDYVFTQE